MSNVLPMFVGELGQNSIETEAERQAANRDDEVLHTIEVLCPARMVELRALFGPGKSAIERFTDHVQASLFAHLQEARGATAVYVGLNPFDPSRIANVGVDNDAVTSRENLLIDVDPTRPPDSNATDEEKAIAAAVATHIKAHLGTLGFPEPIEADSGNGSHLIYRIDLPNDAASAALVRRFLECLAHMFDCDGAHVDTKVFNASRITKLYGTLTRKGPATSTRPHRRSGLLHIPAHVTTVSREQLERVARSGVDNATEVAVDAVDEGMSIEQRKALYRDWLRKQSPAVSGEHGNDHTYQIACAGTRDFDLPVDETVAEMAAWNAANRPPWLEPELRLIVESAAKHATGERGSKLAPICDPKDPMRTARDLIARAHTRDGLRTRHHQNGAFLDYEYDYGAYVEQDEAAARSEVWKFLDGAMRRTDGKLARFQPTKMTVENVFDALRALCNAPSSLMPPCWLDGRRDLDPYEIIPFTNGLLHAPTRELHPKSPNFFSLNGIGFAFERTAPSPKHFLAFVNTIWPDDQESISTLQEIFGYALVPDTRFQKILLFVGPPRSGKGVLARILRRLVGDRNTCAPTLAAFGRDFGKQVLVYKTLAIISDARISGRTDTASVAETLLSISGEDAQTISRKYLPDWSGQLPTRFVILTNELPNIGDASGALAKRFIILTLKESFYGRENPLLFEQLVPELPGILNWALEGRERLYARGHFIQPESAKELIEEFSNLSSPEAAFLREHTCTEAGASVPHQELFDAWRQWCARNGRDRAGTAQTFGRNVRATLPWVTTRRLGPRGEQERCWEGLRLVQPDEPSSAPAM